MVKEKIILIGGGDHCSSCIDVIEQQNKFEIAGIIDIKEKVGENVLGYPIIATDSDIPELKKEFRNFFITIGHVKSGERRKSMFELLKSYQLNIPVIISPLAHVSKLSVIGEGTIIMHFSLIDVQAIVGRNCIINHGTTIAHSAKVEDNCHVSANCVLGKCTIGEGTFIGGNSWVTNSISIASECVIGSGSNVIRNIEESGIYAGNPAKLIRYQE